MESKRICFNLTIALSVLVVLALLLHMNHYIRKNLDGAWTMVKGLTPPAPADLQINYGLPSFSLDPTDTKPAWTARESRPTLQSPNSNGQPIVGANVTSPLSSTRTTAALKKDPAVLRLASFRRVPSRTPVPRKTVRPGPKPKRPPPAARSRKRIAASPSYSGRPPGRLPCGWTADSLSRPRTRSQGYLACSNGAPPQIAFRQVAARASVTSLSRKDRPCLKRFIRERCFDRGRGQKIPRVAHFVRFGPYSLRLDAFISMVSVARIMKPCVILVHSDVIPHGPLWQALLQLVPHVLHVPTKRPRRIFSRSIKVVEHSADVARLQILLEYGGAYLDTDYFVLRPLDNLYKSPAVIGMETGQKACNGFLLAEPNSRFVGLWLRNYKDFKDTDWTLHSGSRPLRIARQHRSLVRLVWNFHKPNYMQISAYFSRSSTPKSYDFRKMYGLHLYTRMVMGKVFTATRIDRQNNVIGDIVRYILFGHERACSGTGRKQRRQTRRGARKN